MKQPTTRRPGLCIIGTVVLVIGLAFYMAIVLLAASARLTPEGVLTQQRWLQGAQIMMAAGAAMVLLCVLTRRARFWPGQLQD